MFDLKFLNEVDDYQDLCNRIANRIELYKLIKELAHKEVPMKPIIGILQQDCPTCGGMDLTNFYGVKHKYCPNCGQKLDWDLTK